MDTQQSNHLLNYIIIICVVGVIIGGAIMEIKVVRPQNAISKTKLEDKQIEIDSTIKMFGSLYMKKKNLEIIQIFSMIIIVVNTFVGTLIPLPATFSSDILVIIKLIVLIISAAAFTITTSSLVS